MAKIYKVSGYLVDAAEQWNDDEEILTWLEDDGEFILHHCHIKGKDMGEWEDDNPLNYDNPDLAECEKYFKEEPTVPSDRPLPQAGEQYKHFKTGKIVEVVGVSQDTESVGSYSVVYICKDQDNNGKLWHRPLDMFLSKTDKEKYPDATQEFRFEKVDE